MFVIEQPLPAAPAADSEAQVLAQWNAVYDAYNGIACLILGSMTTELHRYFGNSSSYDMIRELKSMFEKQVRVERMDNPNLTMEEYIRLEKEKAHKRRKVFNWQTATYGKIRIDDDLHDLSLVEAEFPTIIINDDFAPQDTLQCKSQVSTPVNDEIDFRISFDESDDASQYIDEFDLNDKTPLFECDEEEQNLLYFNDLFSFNVIYSDDSKSDEDNDDDKIHIKHSSGNLSIKSLPDVINTDDGAYAHGSNMLLETSHDTSNKFFKNETFIKG
ncbi:hypothetical protein Tco_0601098 [Tanacetum coccineum]